MNNAPVWVLLLGFVATLLGTGTVGGIVTWFLSSKQRETALAVATADIDQKEADSDGKRMDTATKQFSLLETYLNSADRMRASLDAAREQNKELQNQIDTLSRQGHEQGLQLARCATDIAIANDKIAELKADLDIANKERLLAVERADALAIELHQANDRIAELERLQVENKGKV